MSLTPDARNKFSGIGYGVWGGMNADSLQDNPDEAQEIVDFVGAEVVIYSTSNPDILSRTANGTASASATKRVKIVAEAGEKIGDPFTLELSASGLARGGATATTTLSVGGQTFAFNPVASFSTKTETMAVKIGDVLTIQRNAAAQLSVPSKSSSGDATSNIRFEVKLVPVTALKVVAQYDDAGTATDNVFGTYLVGVTLPTQFTVTAPSSTDIAGIRFHVGTLPPQDAAYSKAGTKFTFDPGQLLSDTPLKVTAFNDLGQIVGEQFLGTIKVLDRLTLGLEVDVPGRGRVAASSLRLIAGIRNAPLLNFTATAVDLPLDAAYADKLALRLVDRRGKTVVLPITIVNDQAMFSLPSRMFADKVNSATLYDYDFFLTPAAAFSTTKTAPKPFNSVNDPAPHLFVMKAPSWLKKAKGTFTNDDNIQAALGNGTGGYAFKINTSLLKLNLGKTKGTPFKLFDGLSNKMTLGVDVWLYARLTGLPGDAVFKTGEVRLNIELLGNKNLVNETFAPSELGFEIRAGTGLVNAKLLNAPDSLAFSPTRPIDLLSYFTSPPEIERAFGTGKNGTKKWNLVADKITLLSGGLLSSKFDMNILFKAALNVLDIQPELVFDLRKGKLVFSKEKSTVWIAANAKASGEAQADLSISNPILDVIGNATGVTVDLFRASLRGTVELTFAMGVLFNYKSKRPVATQSFARLNLEYKLESDVSLFVVGPQAETLETLAERKLEPIALFGLPAR